ncbi:MAG: PAS domain-containing protein [Candidatus Sulfotelmatobacter sp.]
MLDLRKKIFFWSDVAEQITGYPRIDVLGHAYSDLQGIEDVAVGPGIFEKWHDSWTTVFAGLPIGKKAFRLQARQSPGSGSERSRVAA